MRRDHDMEPGSMLDPTIAFIGQVLHEYRPVEDYRVWTTTIDLYKLFLEKWAAAPAPYPGDPELERLSERQFGQALNVVFPDCPKVKRRLGGKIVGGRLHLQGPLSQRTAWGESD